MERSRHCLLQSLPVDTWLLASNALMPWLPAMENERCDILPLRVNASDDNRSLVHLYCPQSFSVLDTVLGIDQWNSIADLTSGMLKVSYPEPLHAVSLPNLEHG